MARRVGGAAARTPGTGPADEKDLESDRKSGDTGRKAKSDNTRTRISTSRGFPNWLTSQNCGIAFTSYQTGQLFLVGLNQEKKVSFHQTHFTRAMGIHVQPNRIHLASNNQIWRLENVLRKGQRANKQFDRLYVPRNAQFTGDLDAHELGIDNQRRLVFVNTKFSCLAVSSTTHSFKPIWRPPFISKLVPEDRCHLNGLAMQDGVPRYVTCVSRSDSVGGWRDRRWEGGMIIDVQSNEIITDSLSMPHSPRVHNGAIWALDSGRGFLVRIDPKSNKPEDIAFCPGFLRGLAFVGRFAVVTTSLPRDGVFKDLELDANLKTRDSDPKCAIYIIDLQSGGIVEWIELNGHIKELFDVAVIPETQCPSSISVRSPQISSFITVERPVTQA